MKTSKEYKDNLKQGIITIAMVDDILYSYNKRAKNYRDKEYEYMDRARYDRYWYDKYGNEEKCRVKKQMLYDKKSDILSLYPSQLSVVHKLKKYEDSYDYYLYYEFPHHSYHHPITKEELKQYDNLAVIDIDVLETYGEYVAELLPLPFCDKVYELLMKQSKVKDC